MQTLTRTRMVVIKEHMTTMDENVNWMKLTHVLSMFSLNLGPLFVHLPLLQKHKK